MARISPTTSPSGWTCGSGPRRDVVPPLPGPVRALRDGFTDRARSAAVLRPDGDDGQDDRLRAHRLRQARAEVRAAAAGCVRLTPQLLANWNRTTLGTETADFRRGPAFAKGGRERYGLAVDTPERFAACLTQASRPAADAAVPVAARAATVYLDVAFFHPFADGNARPAGLALQFVLLREEVELDDTTLLLTLTRRADDAEGAAGLTRLVRGLASATARRHARRSS
jgi:hypothetical protein